jgi:hypothetical protein
MWRWTLFYSCVTHILCHSIFPLYRTRVSLHLSGRVFLCESFVKLTYTGKSQRKFRQKVLEFPIGTIFRILLIKYCDVHAVGNMASVYNGCHSNRSASVCLQPLPWQRINTTWHVFYVVWPQPATQQWRGCVFYEVCSEATMGRPCFLCGLFTGYIVQTSAAYMSLTCTLHVILSIFTNKGWIMTTTNDRPDLSSEEAPAIYKTILVNVKPKLMSGHETHMGLESRTYWPTDRRS